MDSLFPRFAAMVEHVLMVRGAVGFHRRESTGVALKCDFFFAE